MAHLCWTLELRRFALTAKLARLRARHSYFCSGLLLHTLPLLTLADLLCEVVWLTRSLTSITPRGESLVQRLQQQVRIDIALGVRYP